MEKVTVELTPQECMVVYRALSIEVDKLEEQCWNLSNLLDKNKNNPKYQIRDNVRVLLSEYTNDLTQHKNLMKRFKKA